jgi:membrane-associated protein
LEIVAAFWDLIMRLDVHLADLIRDYGVWVYAILFLIIFAETGLVVTPFLPGDSLLFVAGALWAVSGMNVHALVVLLIIAAILGDAVNYSVGRYVGPRVFQWENSFWFNKQHLERAHAFYERHGGKTIVIARWVPIVRTFAPFVAGIGRMTYPRFALYNVAGAIAWVTILVYGGYVFGNVPIVRQNLSLVIVGIIALSLMPIVLEVWKARRAAP